MKKKPKSVNRRMWAYFSPDGYIQVRTIADTKAMSRDRVGFTVNYKQYEEKGYYLQRVYVDIKPLYATI